MITLNRHHDNRNDHKKTNRLISNGVVNGYGQRNVLFFCIPCVENVPHFTLRCFDQLKTGLFCSEESHEFRVEVLLLRRYYVWVDLKVYQLYFSFWDALLVPQMKPHGPAVLSALLMAF